MAKIKLQDVHKSFDKVEVIKGINIDIEDGEFVVIVGPSGCGKSTLLRMIAGLEDITQGTLEIDGVRMNERQPKDRGIAMVFQTYAIFPHMTVRENVAFGLTINKIDKVTRDAKVNEAARILQMENLLDRRPSELSGGQRQRVAIGRAIVRNPKVFLFDEPLSNLDASLRMDMRMEIGKLHQSLNASMIYVTHDQVEAMTLADKIVVLNDGKVMQSGSPMELYKEPANMFVASFLGAPSMNFINVEMYDINEENVTVCNPTLSPVKVPHKGRDILRKSQAILGLRPQYLRLVEPSDGILNGKVILTERLGAETIVEILLKDGKRVIAAISEDQILSNGKEIGLQFDPKQVHLFSSEDSKFLSEIRK